jgi:hypothetical protein
MKLLKAVLIAGFSSLAAGCYATPAKVYPSLEVSPGLYAVNPVDIAVLPIEDATPYSAAAEVLEPFRTEVQKALIQRGYTPLATEKVDDVLRAEAGSTARPSVVDATWLGSIGGKFGEDAALGIRVTTWDASSLMANGRVRFAADVALVSNKRPEPLWSGSIRGEVKAGGDGPAPGGRRNRVDSVAAEMAEHIVLQQLPPRRP